MQVKIICGTYGHKEDGVIMPKDSNSEPFELNGKRAEELIAAGIAKAVNTNRDTDTPLVTGYLEEEQLKKMGINELRKLAGSLGLPKTGGKEQLINSIIATQVYVDDEEELEEEEEEPPTLIPENPA